MPMERLERVSYNVGKVVINLACVCFFFGAGTAGAAEQESGFTDVDSAHWGYEAITWAKEQGIVDGYPDGTFKPDQSVGQTEFLAMLIRSYQPKDFSDQSSDGDWRTPYIQYGFKMGWAGSYITPPSSKLSGTVKPEISEPRMYVAKLITNASGRNYDFEDSIQYLLDSGLAEGKTDKTAAGFQGNDLLTRAEAVTFIKNVKSKLDMLYPSPTSSHAYDPKTTKLSPFEVFPLDVKHPDEFTSFSDITFKTPSAGYNLIHEPTYTITGSAQKAVGENLNVSIEFWDSGVFVPVKNLKATMTNRELKTPIELPKKGVYRISLFSKQEKIAEDILFATFYVEWN